MQINPGGRLDIGDVVGRDDEIDRYWQVLDRQGLILSAERRIGKTHILLKMCDECRPDYLPFYQDLESVHSVADLVRSIYTAVDHSLRTVPGLKAHIAKWSGLLPKRIAGVDLPSAESTWPVLLADAFNDLVRIADGARVLMLWDEFPLMLHNLRRAGDHDTAIRLLDQLRRPPTLDDVSTTVDGLVNDPHDPANLRYYVNRMSQYYTGGQRALALLALDMIAQQAAPVSAPDLLNLCRHHEPSLDDEPFRDVLALLAEDHYIEPTGKSGAAAYDFRWQLVKRWWKRTRT